MEGMYDAYGQFQPGSMSQVCVDNGDTGTLQTLYSGLPDDPWGYQSQVGGYTDTETGLVLLGNRYYDPSTGRFLTRDPIGYNGGINLYAYADGDPVNNSDPSGLIVNAPGAWESLLPVWGSGRQAVHDFQCGQWGWGVFNTALAVSDVFLLKSLVTDVGKVGLKVIGCFPAGTLIQAQGGEKPVEQVKAGDRVLSADPKTGKQSYQTVTTTYVRVVDELLTIRLADGRSIQVSPEHPFWVEGKGFIAAKRLARSDLLRDVEGKTDRIVSVTSEKGRFTVYNLEVGETHTFFADGFWVHNKGLINGIINDSILGNLGGKSARVTEKGLNSVVTHLDQFGEVSYNNDMIERLRNALGKNEEISGADLSFYTHELYESTLMNRGIGYEEAHNLAIEKYGISPFSVYHPDVIIKYPEEFNNAWFKAWGISR